MSRLTLEQFLVLPPGSRIVRRYSTHFTGEEDDILEIVKHDLEARATKMRDTNGFIYILCRQIGTIVPFHERYYYWDDLGLETYPKGGISGNWVESKDINV